MMGVLMDKVYLYNTMGRKKVELKPIEDMKVRLYACGPTVYNYAHIGNLRAYIFDDILRRVLEFGGYEVVHGMNVTDVGHLVGDGDEGEDKLEVSAKRENIDPLTLSRKYEVSFLEDLKKLNIEMPQKITRATDTIAEQIDLIKLLEEKGYIYKDEYAVYFDTTKLADYGKLSGQKLEDKKTGAREEVIVDKSKKNPQDFVLWFLLAGRYKNHVLHWPSPWGEGFPGWHIECSAISRMILGQPFDIHVGGIDHIGTHHTNEIAQSEAAYGKPLANIWMHNEYLVVDNQKMSKSLGNVYILDDLVKKGFDPIDFRYFCLGAHYRSMINFTWKGLESARATLKRIRALENKKSVLSNEKTEEFKQKVKEVLSDDLDTPKALAILHEANDFELWRFFDRVLALDVDRKMDKEISPEILELMEERETARKEKKWDISDALRDRIEQLGYEIEDTGSESKINKR